jgi:hypothetical protein
MWREILAWPWVYGMWMNKMQGANLFNSVISKEKVKSYGNWGLWLMKFEGLSIEIFI